MMPLSVAVGLLQPASKTLLAGCLRIPQLPLVMSQGNVWKFAKDVIVTGRTLKPVNCAVATCP
jgi:hypothetical protein